MSGRRGKWPGLPGLVGGEVHEKLAAGGHEPWSAEAMSAGEGMRVAQDAGQDEATGEWAEPLAGSILTQHPQVS